MEKQERDFLAAYRAHMYNVQKELQDLVFDEDHDGVIALGEAGQEIVKSVNKKSTI